LFSSVEAAVLGCFLVKKIAGETPAATKRRIMGWALEPELRLCLAAAVVAFANR
jgi:hypothetical protein